MNTPIADMVERLLAEDAPHFAIVTAVRAMEVVTRDACDKALLSRIKKRDGNRERQARHRNRIREQEFNDAAKANDVACVTTSVTRDSVTNAISVTNDVLNLDSSIDRQKESKKERLVVARARGTRLPGDAILEQSFIDAALEIGIPTERLPIMWAEFKDYWCSIPGIRGTKLDWLATWRNRARDIVGRERQRAKLPHKNGAPQGFETLFSTGKPDDTTARSEYDLDLSADRSH